MVGCCSEFTRRNYLKSCAEAGMVDTQQSQALPTYHQSARYSSVSLGTPVGITSRAYKSAGSLPKSFSRNTNLTTSGNGTGRFSHLSQHQSVQPDSIPISTTSDDSIRSSLSPRLRRSNYGRDRNIVMTNPFKLETDSIESYIRSRKPEFSVEKPDTTPSQVETRPTYSIRNMPLRNLDELRETIAIRRNYSKARALGNNYLELDTNFGSSHSPSLSPYLSRKSEEVEGRPRISISPSPSRNQLTTESSEPEETLFSTAILDDANGVVANKD